MIQINYIQWQISLYLNTESIFDAKKPETKTKQKTSFYFICEWLRIFTLRPYYRTFPGWEIIICPRSHNVENSPQVIATEGHQRSDRRTAWKKSLIMCQINHFQCFMLAENCDAWYHTTNQVVSFFKNTHRATLKDKRYKRKKHKTMPSNPDQIFSCSHCNPVCLSCIDLISHKHACSQHWPLLHFHSWS